MQVSRSSPSWATFSLPPGFSLGVFFLDVTESYQKLRLLNIHGVNRPPSQRRPIQDLITLSRLVSLGYASNRQQTKHQQSNATRFGNLREALINERHVNLALSGRDQKNVLLNSQLRNGFGEHDPIVEPIVVGWDSQDLIGQVEDW